MKTILATLLIGAAVALPVGAAQARDNVSIRIDTPEFGFRIGTPTHYYGHRPHYGPPVVIAPAPIYVPPRGVYRPYQPYYGVRHYPYRHHKRWHHWKHDHPRHWDRHHRHDRYDRDWDDWRRDRRGPGRH